MKIITIATQIKNNFIAILSMIIAITALSYNTWRNELTEKNRNIRTAAFETLKELGELQIIINHSYYQHDNAMGNPLLGWGHVAFITDLGQLLPYPIPTRVKKLTEVWGDNWDKVQTNEVAVDKITNEIDQARESVTNVLRQLK